jgi:hypothetical protein
MHAPRRALAALVTALAADANAMCIAPSSYEDADLLRRAFERAEAIVHAKVVEVVRAHEARIRIIESFKGKPSVLKSASHAHTSVALRFEPGMEAVFVVDRGEVSACGRLPPSPRLLKGLRALKR